MSAPEVRNAIKVNPVEQHRKELSELVATWYDLSSEPIENNSLLRSILERIAEICEDLSLWGVEIPTSMHSLQEGLPYRDPWLDKPFTKDEEASFDQDSHDAVPWDAEV